MIPEENTSELSSTALLEKGMPSKKESPEQNLVLIVDDEESVVNALAEFFSMRGYEVERAVTARQALGLSTRRSSG